jgi:hypothetical protein
LTQIWRRRITRSSTCFRLRLRNLFIFLLAGRYARRALCVRTTHASCSRRPYRHDPSLYSRINAHSRSPTPIVPMSVCTNLGPDRPSRLAAYAGYVVLRAHLRAYVQVSMRGGCTAMFHPWTRASRLFSQFALVFAIRARAGRIPTQPL